MYLKSHSDGSALKLHTLFDKKLDTKGQAHNAGHIMPHKMGFFEITPCPGARGGLGAIINYDDTPRHK